MTGLTRHGRRLGAVAATAAVTVLVAACGSSGSTGTAGGTAGAARTATVTSAAAKIAKISTTTGSAGTYLVGQGGRALYLWQADMGSHSSCSGSCAQGWPPVLTNATPKAGAGVKAGALGMTSRGHGQEQVTYHGHPLYYFAGDPGSGTTNGQGSDAFGAKWYLVSPAGTAITKAAGAPPASTTSTATTAAPVPTTTTTAPAAGGGAGW